ncbi:hypothetical protein GGR57DRAFT_439857 [Xylariaceae sp. FL1272]|nr:hypothetical protein GGR57DRAFT_439857 [Xylariaceae sp. FL1272]
MIRNNPRPKRSELLSATDLSEDRIVTLSIAIQMSASASASGPTDDQNAEAAGGSNIITHQETTTADVFNAMGGQKTTTTGDTTSSNDQETTNTHESNTIIGPNLASIENSNANNEQEFDFEAMLAESASFIDSFLTTIDFDNAIFSYFFPFASDSMPWLKRPAGASDSSFEQRHRLPAKRAKRSRPGKAHETTRGCRFRGLRYLRTTLQGKQRLNRVMVHINTSN